MSSVRLSSGFEMSPVGLGTWQSKPGEVGAAVKAAIAAGYRLIDCAYAYCNEDEIGTALAEVFAEGKVKREELFIVSKLWNTRHHPEDVKPSLLESLDKLQLKYLDLYLIHWPTAFKRGGELFPVDADGNSVFEHVDFTTTWKAMEACVDEGLVRSIGLSNFNSQQIQRVVDSCRIRPAVLQIELHPYLQQWKLEDFCRQRNIAVMAYSSFGAPGWSDRQANFPSVSILTDDRLASIGKKYNKTAAQVILRWLYQRRVISIPKSVTPERIQQNIQIFDFELSAEDMNDIKTLDRNLRFVNFYSRQDGKLEVKCTSAPNFPFVVEF